jgi:hypothetical protein
MAIVEYPILLTVGGKKHTFQTEPVETISELKEKLAEWKWGGPQPKRGRILLVAPGDKNTLPRPGTPLYWLKRESTRKKRKRISSAPLAPNARTLDKVHRSDDQTAPPNLTVNITNGDGGGAGAGSNQLPLEGTLGMFARTSHGEQEQTSSTSGVSLQLTNNSHNRHVQVNPAVQPAVENYPLPEGVRMRTAKFASEFAKEMRSSGEDPLPPKRGTDAIGSLFADHLWKDLQSKPCTTSSLRSELDGDYWATPSQRTPVVYKKLFKKC